MTPLEEIEREISYAEKMFTERLTPERMFVFAALYQARAIERLEATVRAIGVQWQQYADIVVPIMQRVDARTEAERAEAQATRTQAQEPAPPGTCRECGKGLGEQHSPHCSRQGKVSIDSLRE